MFRIFQFYKTLIALIFFLCAFVLMSQQRGKFNQIVSTSEWTGNVEFYAANSNSPQALIIGLHPYQSPAWGIRDMLQQSAENYKAILACPDGPDNTLGESVLPLIEWCKENYDIDDTKIILTGYSAGAQTTFIVGPQNYQLFRGIIGIASANSYYLTQDAVDNLGFGIICGTSDNNYSDCQSVSQMIQNMGGNIKFISVDGVEHTGPYYFSSEFTEDWNECYDYIMSIIPKPGQITLESPENGSEDLEIPVTLSWSEDANSDSYEIELSDENTIIDNLTSNYNAITLNKVLENGKEYYWRVRGVNDGGEGPWSNQWYFSTKPLPPTEAATLIEPQNNAINIPTTFVFKWNPVKGATSYNFKLLDQNDDIIQEKQDIKSNNSIVKTIISDLQTETVYKWKVQAENSGGKGPWSEIWQFTTVPNPPSDIVDAIYPEDNAQDVPTILTLSWKKIDDANKYHLQLLKDGNNEFTINDSTITSSEDTIHYATKELEGPQLYKWRVAGINEGGKGPWSEYKTFITWDPTSVSENDILTDISINPNPITDISNLEISINKKSYTKIELIDVSGRIIKEITNSFLSKGLYSFKLNSSGIENGYYFIRINSGNKIKIFSLVIIH